MSEHAIKEYLKTLGNNQQSGFDGNYDSLTNKPSIEDVTLSGDKTFSDLGLESLTNTEIENLLV